MAEDRFKILHLELLRAGIAPRRARRAVLEIEGHYRQLLAEEDGVGVAESAARSNAERRLGTNEELVRRYAAQPELRAWSHRWPLLCFAIAPPVALVAAGFGILFGISAIAGLMGAHLHGIRVTPTTTSAIDLAARVALLWCFPLCVAVAFATLAARRFVKLRWSLTGIVLVSCVASLCNVIVRISGGVEGGEVGGGIGVSTGDLPQQALHAAILAALSFALYWVLRRAPRYHLD